MVEDSKYSTAIVVALPQTIRLTAKFDYRGPS